LPPSTGKPEITGSDEFSGAPGANPATVSVGAEVTDVDPAKLVAVTTTSIVSPTSEGCGT
jgi:hypothetical protein